MFNDGVQHNGQSKSLILYIIQGNEPNLLGHEWLEELRLDWKTIFTSTTVSNQSLLRPFFDQYSNIYKDKY